MTLYIAILKKGNQQIKLCCAVQTQRPVSLMQPWISRPPPKTQAGMDVPFPAVKEDYIQFSTPNPRSPATTVPSAKVYFATATQDTPPMASWAPAAWSPNAFAVSASTIFPESHK